jgi:hypothetical protein
MTIGNLSSKIRQMPLTHKFEMVTPLPIPLKNRNITQKRMDELKQTKREMLNNILQRLVHRLTIMHNCGVESGYFKVLFPDGNCRRCKPVVAV